MVRIAFVLLLASRLATPGLAQNEPARTSPPASMAKSTVKKSASKPKLQKQAAVAESGPCQIGVIPALGDLFTVQKIGLTVFNNEYAEVPVNWGFDDQVFAHVRALAGGIAVRRLAYAKDAFDAYYHPKPNLFRNQREELTNLMRQIAGNAGCERYLVVLRGEGRFDGTNQTLSGVGIVYRGSSLLSRTYLFAYLGLLVFDGQTFEIRQDPNANLEGVLTTMAANLTKNENMQETGESAYPTPASEAANSASLRDAVRAFLTERLDKRLPAYLNEASKTQ
jgi:hypothetical protein